MGDRADFVRWVVTTNLIALCAVVWSIVAFF